MNIRTIAIIDTETTGLDPTTDKIVEIAAVLYSVESRAVIASWSTLVRAIENPAYDTNRIPISILQTHGEKPEEALRKLYTFCSSADVYVAHNASFDREFLKTTASKFLSQDDSADRFAAPWVCSLDDIDWPQPSSSRSLVGIALAHSVGVMQAHRALTDCDILARLFERVQEMGHDLQAIFTRAMRPKSLYQAVVSYDNRQQAKDARFRWDGNRWIRGLADEDAAALKFKCIRVVP